MASKLSDAIDAVDLGIRRYSLHRHLAHWHPISTAPNNQVDQTGISLTLELPGPEEQRKSVRMHFHYALFAEILRDLAKTVASFPLEDVLHRGALRDSAKALYLALENARQK